MAKLARDAVISEALDLLDDVGLDGVTTRRLAARLGVEQPSLYWHFRNKSELLAAMAEAAMVPHSTASLPTPTDDWREWFLENTRSFRRTLLMRRDGARLHAGLIPDGNLDRIAKKMAFLTAAGLSERDAQFAMLAASRFTVGSVLEEQAQAQGANAPRESSELPSMDHALAFEEGLRLIVDGLSQRPDGRAPWPIAD